MLGRRWTWIVVAAALAATLAATVGLTAPPTAAGAAGAGLNVRLVWSRTLPGAAFRASSPMPATLDHGGQSAVVGSLNGNLYAFHLSDGTAPLGWPTPTGHEVDSTPSVEIAPGTILDDVFVGSGSYNTPGGAYESFAPGGRRRWTVAARDPNQASGAVYDTLAIGDINGDHVSDATGGSLGLEAYSLNTISGKVNPGWPFRTNDTVFSSPSLVNLGGGAGPPDVVMGGDSSPGAPFRAANPRPVRQGGVLYAINGHGHLLWFHYFDEVVTSSPAVGDLAGNDRPEIAVGTGFYWHQRGVATTDSTRLFVLDASGRVVWEHDLGGYSRTSPALGDLEGSGRLDVVEATSGAPGSPNRGEIWAFDGAGHVLPNWPRPAPGAVFGSVVTADLTGRGYDDVLVPTGSGLHIYDGRTGAEVAALALNIGMQDSALVTQDPNGTIGITIAGAHGVAAANGTGQVLHYELATGGPLGVLSWPMFRHDPQATGDVPTSVSG